MICFKSADSPKKPLRSPFRKIGGLTDALAALSPEKEKIKRSLLHRMDVLSELEPGWLCDSEGCYGDVPSPEEWEWLHVHAGEYPSGLPKAFVFPTMEGGLRFEWVFVDHIIEVKILPSEKKGIGRVIHTATLLAIPEKTKELPLHEDWTALFDFVKKEREQ